MVRHIVDAAEPRYLRRSVVERRVDHAVVLPKPSDGTVIVLRGAAVSAWDALRTECTIAELQQVIGHLHPEIDTEAIASDVAETLVVLRSEGLVDVRTD